MMTDTDPTLALHATLLAALADPVRLQIVRRLAAAPCCVSELVDTCDVLQPRASRHLAVLREAGLVRVESQGKRRCYSLGRPELVRAVLAALTLESR